MSFSFNRNSRNRNKKEAEKQSSRRKHRRGATTFARTPNLDVHDDGLESFGVFSSMIQNVNLKSSNNKKKVNSLFKPAPSRTLTGSDSTAPPSMESIIARLDAKDKSRGRKRASNSNNAPLVASVFNKNGLDADPLTVSSLRLKRKSDKYVEMCDVSSKRLQQAATVRKSQAGIQSFFSKKSPMQLNSIKTDSLVNDTEGPKESSITMNEEQSEMNKLLAPSILSSSLPSHKTSALDDVPTDSKTDQTKVTPPLSNSISLTISEENTIETAKDDLETKNRDQKEEQRRKLNLQVFSGRLASPNLLAQLNRRHTHNTRFDRNIDSGYHGMRTKIHSKWQQSMNIQLDTGVSHDREITCMEFDADGVLLAVGDQRGFISLYDFDEVNAADLIMRRMREKDSDRERKTIKPFIKFRSGTGNDRISSLRWNPSDENMLAVTILNKGEVRVYDISSSSSNGPLYTKLFDSQKRAGGNLTLQYLPNKMGQCQNQVLVGGKDGTLNLWRFSNGSQGRLAWSINPWRANNSKNGGISEIVHLTAGSSKTTCGLVLVATSIGWFALIDIDNCTRKSFSSTLTPKVMKTWNISQLGGIKKHVLPKSEWMGIRKCYVWADKARFTNMIDSKLNKSVDVGVITCGGWVILMQLTVTKGTVHTLVARVLHRSPTVVQCDSTQSTFYDDPRAPASVPEFASVYGKFDNAASQIIVTKTKPMYQVLPGSDKRVLDQSIGRGGLIHSVREKDGPSGFTLINRRTGRPETSITIPINGEVKQVAIHPDNEWIAVSDSQAGAIALMSLRRKEIRRKS